uniref:HAT C-terminal dimerisation domain-containing protein n=1 Tax=Hordeum vulgare subsp. vulgare TaxID=112509 RepID=A0A8I6YLF5_HORVV
MAVVLRFVNIEGLIRERFLDLVHVSYTCALTLKNKIIAVLVDNGLNVQDIRGQGYDGASNMRGEWNGLKALILQECPYAYYIHCLAHQLQLALVAASREVNEVHNFFQHANFVVNTVSASPKRNELLENQAAEIAGEIELGELDTGRGANQIGSLQRAGDTRWSSHYKSIKSLLKMFAATVSVLRSVATDRSATRNSRGDTAGALNILNTFDFVFILHLMERIMKITDILCVKLQNKSLDIANALDCVSNTKSLLAELRKDGWESLFEDVKSFCVKLEIDIPDMDQRYVDVTKSRNKHDNTTVIHLYKVDVFNVAIDQQVIELNDRFSSQVMELLDLCSSLDPRHDAFDKSKICTLVEKFYPADFSSQERDRLECELPFFHLDTFNHRETKNCKSLADLTKGIIKTGKSSDYPMVERLLRLVITLPVSTSTTERAFSAIKLVKTRLRSKLGDDFLCHCTIVYIEKEIAAKFSSNDIIEIFDTGGRKSSFKLIDM